MQYDPHQPSREDAVVADENTPGHRSGRGAQTLWEQIHRDELRRENPDPKADAPQDLPQPQRSTPD